VIENVYSIGLPVGEEYQLKRNRISPLQKKHQKRRISIVTGIHGDELEGQYVCYLLANFLQKNIEKLKATVDIYPSVNSIGIDSIMRKVPPYDIDLNRAFPGTEDDILPYRIAAGVVKAIEGSEIAIDIHSSNIFLRELPQVRISDENAETLVPLAKLLNIDFIWIHGAVTVLQSTFSHAMNELGTKTLVVEMGVGMRITQEYCHHLFQGILNMMQKLEMIELEEDFMIKNPLISTDGNVHFINAKKGGLFVPEIEHNHFVKKDSILGRIVSPTNGNTVSAIKSPCDGLVFTLREYPIVYEGSLMARIYEVKQ